MRSLNVGPAVGRRPTLGAKIGRSTLIVRNVATRPIASYSGSALSSVLNKVQTIQGKSPEANMTAKDAYVGVAYDVRDALIEKFNKTHAHWAVSRLQHNKQFNFDDQCFNEVAMC